MKIKVFKIIGLFLVFCSFAQAQQLNPNVRVDTAKIRIGEQFRYEISLPKTVNNVIFPEQLELFNLETVGQSAIDTFQGRVIKTYLLTGFDSGAFYIPSQQLLVNNRRFDTDSIRIEVATVPVDTLKNPMFPVKLNTAEPYIFDDFKPLLRGFILGLFIVIFIYFVYNYFKTKDSKTTKSKPAIPPYDLAKSRLDALDQESFVKSGRIKEYYSELTDILRTYLEDEYLIPAKESTTDELIEYIKDLKRLKRTGVQDEVVVKIKLLLQDADLVKFAKSNPSEIQLDQDKNKTNYLIDQFREGLPQVTEETEGQDV
jgi:hypothetical protein